MDIKVKEINQVREIQYSIPESIFALNFIGEAEAACFYEWWEMHGKDDFIKWAKNQDERFY